MHRRRIALYGTLAVCIIATLVGVTLNAGSRISPSALAHDQSAINSSESTEHPPVFTFEANRTSGATVVFSGKYAVWNTVDNRYQPGSNQVSVDIQDGSDWATVGFYKTDASGQYSGSERIPGAYPVRARATDSNNRTLAVSQDVMLPFDHAGTIVWSSVRAMRVAHDTIEIKGNANGAWARDPDSGNIDYLGRFKGLVAIQAKVDGAWTTLKRVNTDDESAFDETFTTTATTFRVKVPGDVEYKRSVKVFSITEGF